MSDARVGAFVETHVERQPRGELNLRGEKTLSGSLSARVLVGGQTRHLIFCDRTTRGNTQGVAHHYNTLQHRHKQKDRSTRITSDLGQLPTSTTPNDHFTSLPPQLTVEHP